MRSSAQSFVVLYRIYSSIWIWIIKEVYDNKLALLNICERAAASGDRDPPNARKTKTPSFCDLTFLRFVNFQSLSPLCPRTAFGHVQLSRIQA